VGGQEVTMSIVTQVDIKKVCMLVSLKVAPDNLQRYCIVGLLVWM
jgi:hypothetical protein